MAAAHPGGLRPHPPSSPDPALLRDDLAGAGRVRRRAGILAGRGTGCHRTPAQVKGASGVASDDAARHPCPAPGEPAGAKRVPDEEMPEFPPAGAWRQSPPPGGAGWDSAAGQMFNKNKSGK